MSQKKNKETKVVAIRDLTLDDKDRIRGLLKYGDTGRIAVLCSVSYQQVINVHSPKHTSDTDEVWLKTIEYLQSLPEVEISARLAAAIKNEEEDTYEEA